MVHNKHNIISTYCSLIRADLGTTAREPFGESGQRYCRLGYKLQDIVYLYDIYVPQSTTAN